MIDTGLVDPHGRVGFEIEPGLFDSFRRAGELTLLRRRQRTDSSGTTYVNEVGQLAAQLIDPVARTPVGPKVMMDVMRGVAGVPNRVGTALFHKLTGCRVVRDLDARLWSVEYP
jgi:hypothetical protein